MAFKKYHSVLRVNDVLNLHNEVLENILEKEQSEFGSI